MSDKDTEQQPTPDAPEASQPEQPAQPNYPQFAVNMTLQGLHVGVMPAPVQLTIGPDGMKNIVKQWLSDHPELLNELLRDYIAAMQAAQKHLALVTPDTETVRRINKRGKVN